MRDHVCVRREQAPIDRVDLDMLVEALDDLGGSWEWYFDPKSGNSVPDVDAIEVGEDAATDVEGMIFIEPRGSRDAYNDMVRFAEAVADRSTQRRLFRALDGKGAFRRFRDEVWSNESLVPLWRQFETLGGERRALQWLELEELVSVDELQRAFAVRRAQENAILAQLSRVAGLIVEADSVTERWPDIVAQVGSGATVEITRNGEPWGSIEPAAD